MSAGVSASTSSAGKPFEHWPIMHRLALASLVQRHGMGDWNLIARQLRACISRVMPDVDVQTLFTARSCAYVYTALEEALIPGRNRRRNGGTLKPASQLVSVLSIDYVNELNKYRAENYKLMSTVMDELQRLHSGDLNDTELDNMLKVHDRCSLWLKFDVSVDDRTQEFQTALEQSDFRGAGGFWRIDMKEEPKEAATAPKSEVDTDEPPAKQRRTAAVPAGSKETPNRQSPRKVRPSQGAASTVEVVKTEVTPKVESSEPSAGSDEIDFNSDMYKRWKAQTLLAWRKLSEHRHANIFASPVTETMAPGYRKTVRLPMDLSTIKKRIEQRNIISTIQFERDLYLMFSNAVMYNPSGDAVFVAAQEMSMDAPQIINECMHSLSAPVGADAVAAAHRITSEPLKPKAEPSISSSPSVVPPSRRSTRSSLPSS